MLFTGGHINDKEYLKKEGIDTYSVSRKISQMYAEMIFKYGYVHCDPHPGNVLVSKDVEGQPQIVLLDHGLYTVSFIEPPSPGRICGHYFRTLSSYVRHKKTRYNVKWSLVGH